MLSSMTVDCQNYQSLFAQSYCK